ncbi:hypothetical protein BC828DRAFT_372930 [Blastocladiella britannica]|nr:hypothetical protein BC828DRAFT_372930 [Blastocladiella britannica]
MRDWTLLLAAVFRVIEVLTLHTIPYLILLAITLRSLVIVFSKSVVLRKRILTGVSIALLVVLVNQKVAYLVVLAQMVQQDTPTYQ